LFRQAVDHDQHVAVGAVVQRAWGKVFRKVHRDVKPLSLWDRQRPKQALFLGVTGPRARAGTAVVTVALAVIAHARPIIVEDDLPVCSLPPRVASSGWLVVSLYNPLPETIAFRNIEPLINLEPVVAYRQVYHGELNALGSNRRGQPW
jgi:hypothetical protein